MAKIQFPNHKEIIGKKFGRLSVLKYLGAINPYGRKRNYSYYRCRCDCGNIKTVQRTPLLNGDSRSCGCLHLETVSQMGRRQKKQRGEASLNSLLANYKREAKRKDLPFKLTRDQFKKLTGQNCFYCGSQPSSSHCHKGLNGAYIYNGVDRIDSKYGYLNFNCLPCCMRCNQMKNDMLVSEFVERISIIHNRIG